MTVCANAGCRTSLDGRRPQAKYCCGSCRAAASHRKKAAQWAVDVPPTPDLVEPKKAHRNRTEGVRRSNEYSPATPADEARGLRLMRDNADLWDHAA